MHTSPGTRNPRHTIGLAIIAVAVSVALLGFAAWQWVETERYVTTTTDDASLAGVGYLLAAATAVPAVLGLMLAGTAVGVRGRFPRAGLGLAVAALIAVGIPVGCFAALFAASM